MRAATGHNNRKRLEVQMTPMIDVIFLLLIFFICTAGFQRIELVLPTHLTLPGQVQSDLPPPDKEFEDLDTIVIQLRWVDGRPQWEINGGLYGSLPDVQSLLAAIATQVRNDLPVVLDIDAVVPMENVIDLYDVCRLVGLTRVQFAASPETVRAATLR